MLNLSAFTLSKSWTKTKSIKQAGGRAVPRKLSLIVHFWCVGHESSGFTRQSVNTSLPDTARYILEVSAEGYFAKTDSIWVQGR